MRAATIFSFLRGAVRGAYGVEDFRQRPILLVGMSKLGQEILQRLCIEGTTLRFQDSSLINYKNSFAICKKIDVYKGEIVEIILDLANNYLCLKHKVFPLDKIQEEDAYTQGIHEFYLT